MEVRKKALDFQAQTGTQLFRNDRKHEKCRQEGDDAGFGKRRHGFAVVPTHADPDYQRKEQEGRNKRRADKLRKHAQKKRQQICAKTFSHGERRINE